MHLSHGATEVLRHLNIQRQQARLYVKTGGKGRNVTHVSGKRKKILLMNSQPHLGKAVKTVTLFIWIHLSLASAGVLKSDMII